MIDEKTMINLNGTAEAIIGILHDLPYFEANMVLEICKDTLRLTWMSDVIHQGGLKDD